MFKSCVWATDRQTETEAPPLIELLSSGHPAQQQHQQQQQQAGKIGTVHQEEPYVAQ